MKQKSSFIRNLIFFLILIVSLSLAFKPAAAQGAAVLAVAPAQVDLPLGEQFVIELTVTNGVAVNAFDIKLTYDQGRLSLKSWAHGGYLSALSCVNEIKSPGLLELDCTQLGQDEVSGDGVLLELVFNTLALGTADVTLEEAVFVDAGGLQTQPERASGVVNVQNLPTWTQTPTQTATPTRTSTATVTQTATQVVETPKAVDPSPTHTPSLAPSPTLTPDHNTPTLAGAPTQEPPIEGTPSGGPPTKTLTTPISGVAGPSHRGPTPTFTSEEMANHEMGTLEESEKGGASVAQAPDSTAAADAERDASNDNVVGELDGVNQNVRSVFWNRFLLIVLILSLVSLVVMIAILIRRRTQKDEDLLL